MKKKIAFVCALVAVVSILTFNHVAQAEEGRETVSCPDGLKACAKVNTPTGPKFYHKGN